LTARVAEANAEIDAYARCRGLGTKLDAALGLVNSG